MSNRKQSLLLGGLISSAGILISKFLGLLYVVPFNDILGTAANRMYYAQTYNIYSYILNIATAGLPFAIATLVARYMSREDYRTCLLVKKISFYTMTSFGFICMMFVILFSPTIAQAICPKGGNVDIMRTAIVMISFAIFIIPVLSSLRGFYQGLKELELFSFSQVLEQISRILFLLTMGSIAVYVLKQDHIWALYFGVMAASVAGVITILYIRIRGNDKLEEVKQLAKEQPLKTKANPKVIFRELILVAIPFLLTSIFGYSDTIINQFDLKPGLEAFGSMPYTDALSDAIFYKATKIIAIPMILTPGFGAAMIPFITSAVEKKNGKLVRKYIIDCIEPVLYLAIPLCFSIFAFATPIIFTLFGGEELALNSMVLKWYSLEALCATLGPIFGTIVMAIGHRKAAISISVAFAITKLCCNRFFISIFGVGGIVISSFVAHIVYVGLNVMVVQKEYHVKWKYTFRKLLIMGIGLVGYYIVFLLFDFTGLVSYSGSRILSCVLIGFMGLTTCGTYVAITALCGLPQSIFHFQFSDIIRRFKRRG